MSNIYLHNTLSGKKEKFVPISKGKVKIYSCGPTVYDFAHIGNFRSFLMSDLLLRVFRYAGYDVTKVQNITDVGHLVSDHDEGEDKILKKARLEKKDPFAIARFFEDAFVEDETKLRIIPPDHRPRATDFIAEQIEWCEKLIADEFAYESNGSVFFRISKYEEYGQLSKNKMEDLVAGARVDKNPDKENPLDFALWRAADPNHLMQWDSPWGRGFPGWHLECSVMSHTLLDFPFDIHTGGEDNIFPHHECEIAQNAGFSHKKSVNYWLHAKHLLVDGEKMSKSKGNFYTVRDLFKKGYSGEQIRYLLISAHYRTALNFTFEGLEMAKSSIDRIVEFYRFRSGTVAHEIKEDDFADEYRMRYQEALFDDLNVSEALATVFDLLKKARKLQENGGLPITSVKSVIKFLENDFDQVFDVFPKEKEISDSQKKEIEDLIEQRKQFRAEKNWAESDRIRDELLAQGIELLDEAGGTTYKLKS